MGQMEIKTTIAGAGITGLSIAAKLSEHSKDIFVIEKNEKFGMETSSRNSEVIHAGIYYPKDSLKLKLCIEGNKLLYKRCKTHRIKHLMCGKLIIATNPKEEEILENIREKAKLNGVNNINFITQKQLTQLEPNIKATAAIHSGSTGIIDSHKLMHSFFSQAKKNGTKFIFNTEIQYVKKIDDGKYKVKVIYPDGKPFSFITRLFINCSGHNADTIAESMGIDIDKAGYRQYFWKGEYFSVNIPPFTVNRLIYPVPLPNNTGLGIHATIDIYGRLKIGPNAIYLADKKTDYSVSPLSQDIFFHSVKEFLPFIKKEDLTPDMAGIRPKLQKPGDPFYDFIIHEESDKGLSGIINLIGIESPGLTSCIAISNYVENLINQKK